MNKKILYNCIIIFLFGFQFLIYAQSLKIHIDNYKSDKVVIYSLIGEKVAIVDSITAESKGNFEYSLSDKKLHQGFYRIAFDKKKQPLQNLNQTQWIDFVIDNENVSISTDINNIMDSLKIIESESNKWLYSFLKLNIAYKTKNDLLQVILSRYPKDDDFYKTTQNKLTQLQNEYIEFVNVTAQRTPKSFIAKYIRSEQLPIVDISVQPQQQLSYLKAHALDNVDFKNSALVNSDVFTSKTIEYLTYYRNPQLPKELLEKEFIIAIDTLLNKAKVQQYVYKQITEYLIDGFKKFGFDKALDYIVDNYVIKDDICLDIKTEGMIKKRIEQAKNFKVVVALFAGHQRLAAFGDGLAEIEELALERFERNGHRVGGSGRHLPGHGRRLAGIVFHIPGCQLVAGDHRRALGAVQLDALGIARPESGGGLDHACGAAGVSHHGVHHVFGFDFVERAQLPYREHPRTGPASQRRMSIW